MKEKIVMISFATHPHATPRAFRTHELAVELASQGYNITLYVLTGKYDYSSYSTSNNIKIKSLGKTYLFNFEPSFGILQSFRSRVLNKLFHRTLHFPTIELIRNTYNVLNREDEFDLLITIAIPHTIHWGAALYRRMHGERLKNTTWIADCGDPFMGNPFFRAPIYFKYLEELLLKEADFITVPTQESIKGFSVKYKEKIKVIPQGFRFKESDGPSLYKKNSIPTFIYAGNFYPNYRDPRPFLDYLLNSGKDFKFIIYTQSKNILLEYEKYFGSKLHIYDFIPREALINKLSEADFLINLENPSTIQSPSKLIDYALSGRPILSLNTNSTLDYTIIDDFMSGDYSKEFKLPNIEQYNIKNVARKFINLWKKN